MKSIFILVLFCSLFSITLHTQAQDYFKERRYDGIDFSNETRAKYYRTIGNKKYEIVDKEEEVLLNNKLSFDTKQRIFYTKRGRKTMGFKETIKFMNYVGNKQSAADLKKSMTYYYAGFGTTITGFFVGTAGFFITLANFSSTEGPKSGLIVLGTGGLMYGGGILLYKKGNSMVNKTLRYHNKNINKFSKPVLASTNFIPSNLGFKPVRTNLLNPTPVATLSMSWSF